MIDVEYLKRKSNYYTTELFNKRYLSKNVSSFKKYPGYTKVLNRHLFDIESVVNDIIQRSSNNNDTEEKALADIDSYLRNKVLNEELIQDLIEIKPKGISVSNIIRKLKLEDYSDEVLSVLEKSDYSDLVTQEEVSAKFKELRNLQKSRSSVVGPSLTEDSGDVSSGIGTAPKSKDIMWIRSLCSHIITSLNRKLKTDSSLKIFLLDKKTESAVNNLSATRALMSDVQIDEVPPNKIRATCELELGLRKNAILSKKSFNIIINVSVKYSPRTEENKMSDFEVELDILSRDVPITAKSIKATHRNLLKIAEDFVDDSIATSLYLLKENKVFKTL